MQARETSSFVAAVMLLVNVAAWGDEIRVEVSADGRDTVVVEASPADGTVISRGRAVLYGTAPDWQNTLRVQVGGLTVADMNGDGRQDVVVGCYTSQSYPPYPDWENLIYYNTGTQLEASPSWVSTDEVSTTDVEVGDINSDGFMDVFSANGGFAFSPSVIYWGSATGPSQSPGWSSQTPQATWATDAALGDLNRDGYLEVVTSNQGVSPDPFRPMYKFHNNNGTLETVPSWQSLESSIQSWVAFGDYNNDGWDDLAVSKWNNSVFSGIHRNRAGSLDTVPIWTTPVSDTDKGVAWADVDGNGWLDLALGHSPTQLYGNTGGALTLVWSSQASTAFSHQDLKFCDVDRDGDPDLAEIHFSSGRTHIYLNNDGVLDSLPTWVYDAPSVGTALAFGDINGDQWPDLVIGYSGNPSVVVFYAQPPPPPPGDCNGDYAIDLADYLVFHGCHAGPNGGLGPECGCVDMDGDGDVDLADFAGFAVAMSD